LSRQVPGGLISHYGLNVDLQEVRRRKSLALDRLTEQELEMMPYALEMLRSFHGRYPMGIVTSCRMEELAPKFKKFAIRAYVWCNSHRRGC
jgi:phosphoglycolate phosphatase-like HAD superfamily hydrolase